MHLTVAEGAELELHTRSRVGRAHEVLVARVLLLLAEGCSYRQVAQRLNCSQPFISKWKRRMDRIGRRASTSAIPGGR